MPRASVTLEKQPFEERIFDFDFVGLLVEPTDTIVSGTIASVANLTGGSNDVVAGNVAWSGSRLQATYSGGTAGHRYLVTARATDSKGQKLELEGILEVRER